MNSLLKTFGPRNIQDAQLKAKFVDIDESMRTPAVFFILASLIWLIIGSLLALLASYSLHSPNLLPNWEWLTFGRLRSAHLNAVAFGWTNNAVYAVSSWIMLRLCQTKLHNKALLMTAGVFWNIAIGVGVTAILAGQLTSIEWLEMPKYITPLVALSYVMIGIWSIMAFRYRQSKHVYVSQWYMLAAFFWFPWLYIIVQSMVIWFPARGVVQAITNWWFGHNALGLWFTPMSVAALYYLIPKVLGRPIHSYYLSVLGFWTLAIFYNWAGMHHLIGGPVPAWILSAGIVGSIMMVIPVFVTAINHHFTAMGHWRHIWLSPTLRFAVFAAMSYTLSSFFGSAMALREVNKITHFTHFTVGHAHHGAYAFVAMAMFASFYYMLPRILKKEWPSARLISIHFWTSGTGIFIYVVGLSIGGWIQGLELNNPDIPFLETVANTVPWLISRSVGGTLMTIGHFVFFYHVIWMLRYKCTQEGPTLFGQISEEKTA